jgi:outer membrane protein insertion porin family
LKTTPNSFRRHFPSLVLFLVLFVSLVSSANVGWTQTGAGTGGVPTIRKVEVKFTGVATVTEEIVRANMSLRDGMPYDDTLIDRDIQSLYRTGLFEFIEVRRIPVSGNQVDVVFELRPKFRVGAIRFEGNRRVSTRRLEAEITIRNNFALDERMVKEDADKITEHYRKNGYSQARVEYVIERNPVTGYGTVVFKIEEGDKVKIRSIDFVGNEAVKDRALRKQMEVRKWWFLSWLTGSGRFDDKKFDEDLAKVRDYYRERGFLDVEIDLAKVTFSYPSASKMTITIPVKEGRQYRIGEVKVTGVKLFPVELVRRIARVETGDVYAPGKLGEEQERVQEFYGQFGYLETNVRVIRRPNVTTGAIDLEFVVDESERYYVESVEIDGNTKTKSIVVLREVLLAPGDVFDSIRMETSRARLENTRFFEDVDVRPESTNIPNRKKLKISFREGRTGNLTFGAGFSSLESAVFFIELTQSNFDLLNRRSMFQGDGQKFRLKAQIGSRSSELVMAFEEPWLFEQALAFGFQVYRTRSDYTSSIYDELRYGFEVYIRRALFELVVARLSYRWETIDIFNVSSGAFSQFFGIDGERSVSKVGLALERDTRNNLITTTRGSRFEGIFEVAGGPFGSDVDYYRLEGRAAHYFPLFEEQRQVLEVIGRLGVVNEFGDSTDVPFFDRFFLGGPNTLRGFEFREVGPKIGGEPSGGKTYGFLSLEYSLDIVAPVRFALFYDAGFVNKGAFDFNPTGYNDNFGFGIRFFVLGSPLRLDYGIPITTDRDNDEGNQFNFSFGTRF